MLAPDGRGDLRNGGPIVITIGNGPRLEYKNTEHFQLAFEKEFSNTLMKMDVDRH